MSFFAAVKFELNIGHILVSVSITGVKRILMQVLHQEIQVFVSNKCKGNFETPLFLKIMNWKDAVIVPFVKDIVCHDLELYNREEWAYQLNLAVSESFCNLRIQEMFDIITDFPDSQTCGMYNFDSRISYCQNEIIHCVFI